MMQSKTWQAAGEPLRPLKVAAGGLRLLQLQHLQLLLGEHPLMHPQTLELHLGDHLQHLKEAAGELLQLPPQQPQQQEAGEAHRQQRTLEQGVAGEEHLHLLCHLNLAAGDLLLSHLLQPLLRQLVVGDHLQERPLRQYLNQPAVGEQPQLQPLHLVGGVHLLLNQLNLMQAGVLLLGVLQQNLQASLLHGEHQTLLEVLLLGEQQNHQEELLPGEQQSLHQEQQLGDLWMVLLLLLQLQLQLVGGLARFIHLLFLSQTLLNMRKWNFLSSLLT